MTLVRSRGLAARTAPGARSRTLGLLLLLALVLGAASAGRASAAAPATCTSAGGGKYNCDFYTPGDGHTGGTPVENSAGKTIGYLHQGTNYIYCERLGAKVTNGAYYNNHWAYTDSDTGPSGWVNAVFASGGDNDGAFGTTPDCHNVHGNPPGGQTEPGTPAPTPAPTPTPTPAPTPPPVPQPKSCASTPGPGDNVTRWHPVVVCVLGMLGQPSGPDIIHAIDILIQHESSGNPRAINLTDSNAQAGHPSKGLIQTIPSTFQANRSQVLPNDIYDPAANIYAGLNYGINRYGSVVDIPGIDNVLHGRPYVGYAAAQTKGVKSASRCSTLRVGSTLVRYRAGGSSCSTSRSAVRSLSRAKPVRALSGLATNLALKAASRSWVCDAERTGTKHVKRTVSCQSGPRTVWFQVTPKATKRAHRRS